jgi:hypothetical protein
VSADGAIRLVGGPHDNSHVGAAWLFGSGPAVLDLTPTSGPHNGGTEVTITGSNLSGVTAVHFGAADASSFKVLSRETLVATTPAGEGTVDVTVTSPYGTSLPGVHFRYLGASRIGGGGSGGAGGIGSIGSSSPPAAGSGVLGVSVSSASTCRVALSSRKISVLAHARAAFKLRVTGAGRCAGKLRLRVRRPIAHRRTRVKTIGTAVFSIPAGHGAVVAMKLNAAGRTLLRSHHWRLSASLLLVRQSPAPALAQTAGVRLARPAKHSAKHT